LYLVSLRSGLNCANRFFGLIAIQDSALEHSQSAPGSEHVRPRRSVTLKKLNFADMGNSRDASSDSDWSGGENNEKLHDQDLNSNTDGDDNLQENTPRVSKGIEKKR
jgi:hypothetical protein